MPQWTDLSPGEQQEAREILSSLRHTGVQSNLSQVARHWNDALAWASGRLTLDLLCKRAGWSRSANSERPGGDEAHEARRRAEGIAPVDPSVPSAPPTNLLPPTVVDIGGTRYLRCLWLLVHRAVKEPGHCGQPLEAEGETLWLTGRFRTLDGSGPYPYEDIQSAYMSPKDLVYAEFTTEQPRARRGRPAIGPKVETRLDPADLARVMSYGSEHGQQQADALRDLILLGLSHATD